MSLLKAMLMGGTVRQDSVKVVTYVGTGAERAITGVGFQPDFVWIKNRDAIDSHKLIDSVRGVTKALSSDTTGIEVTEANGLKSFDEDGFTLGTDVSYNTVGEKYVAWCWKADRAGVTDATQEEQYNASAGLSIIKYVGDGVAGRTLTHSLARTPKLVIVKRLDSARDWRVQLSDIPATNHLKLNETTNSTVDTTLWNSTYADDSVVTLGSSSGVNANNYYCIAYCFAEVPNVSSIGSYTGTGAVGNVVNFGEDTYGSDVFTSTDAGGANLTKNSERNFTVDISGEFNSNRVTVSTSLSEDNTIQATLTVTGVPCGIQSYDGSAYVDHGVLAVGTHTIESVGGTLTYYRFETAGATVNIDSIKEVIPQGFQPAYLMIKRTDSTGSWVLLDNKRDTHNPNTAYLEADTSDIETIGMDIDFTSTGFEIQSTDVSINASGGEYIYMAFAELPQESSPENRAEPLFSQVAYTGDGTVGHSIDGLNFKPDLVWVKNRDAADSHQLFDIIRGVGLSLASDTTAAELPDLDTLMAFGADGFTVGADVKVNTAAEEYVAWAWNAGGEAVPSEDGSIASTIMANVEGGFSIVKWTGTGVDGTVGHGLGAAPDVILTKRLDVAEKWTDYFSELGATKHIRLNDSLAAETAGTTMWQETEPTSEVFSIGTDSALNASGEEYIAYCWTSKSGVSDFGSYTGTGTVTGEVVNCGFKPDYVMMKRTDAIGGWVILDIKRDNGDVLNHYLYGDVSNTEATPAMQIILTSTGFQLNTTNTYINASGGSYIYMAFKVGEDPDTLHQVETGNLQISDSLADDNGTHTITVVGDTHLDSSDPACGSNSIVFDGTGDALTAPTHADFSPGDGDFTLDCFINPTVLLNDVSIMHQFAGVTGWSWEFSTTGLKFWTNLTVLNPATITLIIGSWQHIALVRYGDFMLMYHKGVLRSINVYTSTANGNTSTPFGVGNAPGVAEFEGGLDHLRLTKGVALWTTTNFNLSDKGLYYPSGTLQI